jgi:predicted nuclease of predicted toxin-antitoxin system
MRVLLDECVPRQLRRDLEDFDVKTVREMGWAGVKNGALLDCAKSEFDAIFTVDRELEKAHARVHANVAVVVLAAGTTDPVKLRPFMSKVRAALRRVQPGEIVRGDASRQ